jgi:hypothetical protein
VVKPGSQRGPLITALSSGNDSLDLAVFTIVQDDPEFIHPWINHYKKHVADPRHIYVLVHALAQQEGAPTRESSASAWSAAEALMADYHGATIVPVHHASSFDHAWLAETVSRFQSFLLQSFRWVLFAECDEFLLPTPGVKPGVETMLDIVACLQANPPPAVRATGFEVLQQDGEAPLPAKLYQDGRNVALTAGRMIEDRNFWYSSWVYSKTLLANVPLRWGRGFHKAKGHVGRITTATPSPLLTLVHLHKVDFALALARSRRSAARKWSRLDLEQRYGWQNRITEETTLRAFWREDRDTGKPIRPDRLAPIPPDIKKALR